MNLEKKNSKKKSKMRARDILQGFKSSPPSDNNVSGATSEKAEEFRVDIEHRLEELEQKVKYGLVVPDAPIIEAEKIVVSYGEFTVKKEEGDLFEEEDNTERIDASKFQLKEAEYKEKLKKNDSAVYEMYNKYKYLLEELDLYKDKLLERIAEDEFEGDTEEDGENGGTIDPRLDKKPEDLTEEEKDYQIYLLVKELKLVKWNSNLDGSVDVLKKNNVQNNAHIREQKVIIDKLNLRLDAAEDDTKTFRTSLKDFKLETKNLLLKAPKKDEISEVIKNGEIDPLNETVKKLTQHITVRLEIYLCYLSIFRNQ